MARHATHSLTPPRPVTGRDDAFRALQPRALKRVAAQQPASFWFLCAYFFIEYVRPQSVWESLAILPWGTLFLALTLGGLLLAPIRGREFTAIDAGMVAYSLIILLSSITSTFPVASRNGWMLFFNWILVYVLVTQIVNDPRRYLLFLLLFLLWSFKMSNYGTRTFAARGFSFAGWGATGAPGWFQNSGEFAIQMCVFIPMAYYFFYGIKDRANVWVFRLGILAMVGTAVISLVASSSRGGQLAGGLVLLVLIAQSRHQIRGTVLAGLVMCLMWVLTPAQQKARFQSMGDDGTSQSRLTYWKDGIEILKEHPLLGIGYDAWEPYYHTHYNPHGELPHNIFVEAGSELGYLGLAGFVFLICATFYMNRKTRRLARKLPDWGGFIRASAFGLDAALVGYLASGFFVTVLYYPYFWVNLAFTGALYETARRLRRSAPAVVRVPTGAPRPARGHLGPLTVSASTPRGRRS